jgi:hypothetical protein
VRPHVLSAVVNSRGEGGEGDSGSLFCWGSQQTWGGGQQRGARLLAAVERASPSPCPSPPHPPRYEFKQLKAKEGAQPKLLFKKRMFRETDETVTEPQFVNLSYIQAQHDYLQVGPIFRAATCWACSCALLWLTLRVRV